MPRRPGKGMQFLDVLPDEGERRLMLAVLMDAVHSCRGEPPAPSDRRARRAWLLDQAWFQSEERSSPFAFAAICDALGLDAGYIRRLVRGPADQRRPRRVRRYVGRVEELWAQRSREYRARAAVAQAG